MWDLTDMGVLPIDIDIALTEKKNTNKTRSKSGVVVQLYSNGNLFSDQDTDPDPDSISLSDIGIPEGVGCLYLFLFLCFYAMFIVVWLGLCFGTGNTIKKQILGHWHWDISEIYAYSLVFRHDILRFLSSQLSTLLFFSLCYVCVMLFVCFYFWYWRRRVTVCCCCGERGENWLGADRKRSNGADEQSTTTRWNSKSNCQKATERGSSAASRAERQSKSRPTSVPAAKKNNNYHNYRFTVARVGERERGRALLLAMADGWQPNSGYQERASQLYTFPLAAWQPCVCAAWVYLDMASRSGFRFPVLGQSGTTQHSSSCIYLCVVAARCVRVRLSVEPHPKKKKNKNKNTVPRRCWYQKKINSKKNNNNKK